MDVVWEGWLLAEVGCGTDMGRGSVWLGREVGVNWERLGRDREGKGRGSVEIE